MGIEVIMNKMNRLKESFATFSVIMLPLLTGIFIGLYLEKTVTFPYHVEVVDSFQDYQDNFIKKKINIIAIKQPFHINAKEYEGDLPVVYAGENMPLEIEYIKNKEIKVDYDRIIYCDDGKKFDVPYHIPLQPPGKYILDNKIISEYMLIPQEVSHGVKCKMYMPTEFFTGAKRPVEFTVVTEDFIVKER